MSDDVEARKKEAESKLAAFWERAKPLLPYLADPTVDEIAINRPGEVVSMRKGRWEAEGDPSITEDFLKQLGKRLSNYAQKGFDEDNTSLSTLLPTGERVEMTHPPTSPTGFIYLNIRKHTAAAIPHSVLIESGYYKNTRHEQSISMTDEERTKMLPLLSDDERALWELATAGKFPEFMERAVQSYQNIVISGATFSGKTSYMRALVELIDQEDRIITAEDTPEMPLPNHPNHQHLFYKKRNEDQGASAKDVLFSIMRKTPKRVLMAELRGDETMVYLSGVLSSGHPGGISTGHAGSPKELFSRLGLLILMSEYGAQLDMATILKLLYTTVNVVVQLTFDKKTGRHIPSIYYDPMYRYALLG
jgi:type IV secretion system protein VirB11